MKHLREHWSWPTAVAPLVFGVALTLVIASCGRESSPTSPSATGGLGVSAEDPGPTPTPTDPPPDPTPTPTPTGSGRFTGGGFQIIADGGVEVKVTRGFTIHCDNLLTNNLEVNWGGNNFHMDKNSLVGILCTRPVDPVPPQAPVSRISASSPGQCNGVAATISFILEDHGEPGTEDRAELIISGGCSLSVPLANLDGGNIQAHFDQPHK